MRAPAKHLPYFEVLEALQHTTLCALCDLEKRAQHRYFEAVLHEGVNDPGLRDQLEHSRGLCPRHTHLLEGFQDALGITILLHSQVASFRAYLDELAPPRRHLLRRHARVAWIPETLCPACQCQQRAREDYVSSLATWLGEGEIRAAFAAAPGPCVAHFLMLHKAAGRDENRLYLMQAMTHKLDVLLGELDEFRRKSGHHGRHEAFGPERDAWVRAGTFMVGVRDVF